MGEKKEKTRETKKQAQKKVKNPENLPPHLRRASQPPK